MSSSNRYSSNIDQGISITRQRALVVLQNTNFFATALRPRKKPALWRIQFSPGANGTLRVLKTNSGATTDPLLLNSGVTQEADEIYIWDILVMPGDTVNFQYSVNDTINILEIVEIPSGS